METKMGKTLEPMLGLLLLNLLFCCGQAHDAVLTFEPNWSTFYSGEFVTLTCDMNEGEDSQWEYKLNNNNKLYLPYRPHKSSVLLLHSGEYQCCGRRRSSGQKKCSNTVTVSGRPTAKLTAGSTTIPVGGSVTLSCSVDSSAGWKYRWLRRTSDSSYDKFITNNEENRDITVTQGGIYRCAGRRGNPAFISHQSHNVTIKTTFSNKVVATRRPNWPEMFSGESITLTCEIQGGETTEWMYEWRPTNRNSPPSSEYRISYIAESDSGEYSCRGIRNYELTEWSDAVRLTVTSSPPQPVLSVSPSWPNPGASVTLSCEGLELQSAGWRFFWYKAVPDPSKLNYQPSYTYVLLPNTTNGTEQNSFIINGPTQTAGYQCRAGRGEPKFYTHESEVKFIWPADPGSAASLSVNPDRVQHFRSDSLSLSCEGNFTEWRVMRFTETGRLSDCFYWGTMTGSTCTIIPYYDKNGVYWCESKSGEFSNAVNITVQNYYYDGIILVSPVHPVTEGDPLTLSCRDKKQNRLSNVFFYHNDKLLNKDSREELNISAVLKSDEGFYKCQHSGKESLKSWMSVRVTVSSPASSLFLALLIVGLVVKIVLFLLLLLFLCCRRNNEADEPRAPAYSMIELRNFRKNCSTPTYANINYHKKWKGK